MKTIKYFLFVAAICLVSLQAAAQGIVINKTDGTKVYYDDAEVESVGVYGYGEKPGPQPGGEDEEVKTFTVTRNGMTATFKMKQVEAGTFTMGSEDGEDNEKPVHEVTISKNYYMGETEVTQQLWYVVMGQAPTTSNKWTIELGMGDNYPAYFVNWNDCQEFITKLNALTGLPFRLPTEAEWEFAARGGNKSQGYTYVGSNTIDDVAWCYSNSSSKTHEVATKTPNELGLYDMSGNVWEWCNDWYGNYPEVTYPVVPTVDPTGPTSGSKRVFRGGSWAFNSTYCRVSFRYGDTPTNTGYYTHGFRLALSF